MQGWLTGVCPLIFAGTCGHYPRRVTQDALWLRLEFNHIEEPRKLIAKYPLRVNA